MKCLLKNGRQKIDDILLRLCNVVYNQNSVEKRKIGCTFPFLKKANLESLKTTEALLLLI